MFSSRINGFGLVDGIFRFKLYIELYIVGISVAQWVGDVVYIINKP